MPELTPRAFNQLEVVLWLLFAVVFALRSYTDVIRRRHALVACIAFLLFAGSDAVEVHTGAWWRPWWLLVWKGSCVITFAVVWWTWPPTEKPAADRPPKPMEPTAPD